MDQKKIKDVTERKHLFDITSLPLQVLPSSPNSYPELQEQM